jgi:hypothetical protein
MPLEADVKLTLGQSEPDEAGHDAGGDERPEAQEENTEADGDADAKVAGFGARSSHDERRGDLFSDFLSEGSLVGFGFGWLEIELD